MNLDKLRIMQQIQIALVEEGFSVDVLETCGHFSLQVWVRGRIDGDIDKVDEVTSWNAELAELQLWHDTIVYGPQVSKED